MAFKPGFPRHNPNLTASHEYPRRHHYQPGYAPGRPHTLLFRLLCTLAILSLRCLAPTCDLLIFPRNRSCIRLGYCGVT
jgi:hypothetical protein